MGYSVTTGPLQLPYPDGAEDLDIPGDIQLLAQDVDNKVTQRISDNVVLSAELFLTETPPTPNVQVVDSKMNIYMTPPDLSSKLSRSGGTMTGNIVMDSSTITFSGTGSITVPTPTAAGHAATKSYVDSRIPVGGIMEYAGAAASVPAGWYVCDGSLIPVNSATAALRALIGNNTPDLRSKFIIGSTGETGAYIRGQQYGAAAVTLTSNELPSHTHTINSGGVAHNHTVTVDTGGGSRTPAGSVPATDTNHTHSGGTGTVSSGHTHNFSVGGGDHSHGGYYSDYIRNGDDPAGTAYGFLSQVTKNTTYGTAGGHGHSGTTGDINQNHSHSFETGWKNHNASHAHSFSGSAMDINHAHTASSGNTTSSHTHTAVNTGSGNAFSIIPPAYALVYIIYGGA